MLQNFNLNRDLRRPYDWAPVHLILPFLPNLVSQYDGGSVEKPVFSPNVAIFYNKEDGVNSYQNVDFYIHQAPVVQMLDSAIQQINHYPVDKY